MTRHSKNCTAGTVYTYHERQRDTKSSGYGSKSARFGKDSIKDFDCCCLTLQPCRNPIVTPEGFLYDKEAILEFIIQQKKQIARKLKEYGKQINKAKEELNELAKAELETKKQKLISHVEAPSDKNATGKDESICNMKNGKGKELPSFWVPALTPDAAPTKIEKPDEKVRCPMSGRPIKLKDMLDVKFTPINDRDSKTALISKQARYVCAVTNDVLGNSVPCAVLKTSGSVVTMECVEKLIKKDMLDPINGKKMTEKDILPLQRGSSGYSASGHTLEGKKYGPSVMA
ncbi:nitric oxide synthase-interacting protein-like [Mytilus californianus]|uniref:nitric oxide synthase-interacting protein-like n=1 Tax=Mytilus californianus TaxID=6549 RepID=UPI0022462ACC|nr:nitric oxide synthase-interacting protein-like [Mytilus californianus]XP_052064596.1 nitric oxide synthase-interacting protein-like [Mytilus californianus]XP_052064597.1 nitric oxide synthase-interacting protein-like [Mytilus californianus]